MTSILRGRSYQLLHSFTPVLVTLIVVVLAFILGQRASLLWLALLIAGAGTLLLLARPVLGLYVVILAALILPLEFGTGTVVKLNPVTLLVPALTALWLLDMVRRRELNLVPSSVNQPLMFFLAAGLLSLLIGRATWDSSVPVGGNFLLVQLAQWAIFAFSALAFWLTANLADSEAWLSRITSLFLLVGGGLAFVQVAPGILQPIGRIATGAVGRAPFWALLTTLAGGQLLFNHRLGRLWQFYLAATILSSLYFGFVISRESSSTWVGIGAALGVLVWLRWPRLRWPIALGIAALTIYGVLVPSVYEFAGGDDAWFSTGGSRLALIGRVVEVTLHNPITGLGPAAYRPYANATPLVYAHIFWVDPRVNSHNNYVDLFAHMGLLGLLLLAWLSWAIYRLGMSLRRRYATGFAAGYVNAMLAVGAASLVLMLFADWMLPFVYNIGFNGFQASVLVWLFLGGLVALENSVDPAPHKS